MATASHSTANIAACLQGIDFPAKKQDLINHARKNNTEQEIIQTLEKMPDENYTNMADVFKGVRISESQSKT